MIHHADELDKLRNVNVAKELVMTKRDYVFGRFFMVILLYIKISAYI